MAGEFSRAITARLDEMLTLAPVVLIRGPRQAGKTTLARQLATKRPRTAYITLDDMGVLAALTQDAAGFLRNIDADTLIIDEVQRRPQMFVSIKQLVDEQRRPGRFVLTGSADVMQMPLLSDSLAGRIQFIDLWPMAQCEMTPWQDGPHNAVDALFDDAPIATLSTIPNDRREMRQRLLLGGFPELVQRQPSERLRAGWFEGYVNSILARDVRDLSQVQKLEAFPKLVRLLAARAGSLINAADLAQGIATSTSTTGDYISILRQIYLLVGVPAWARGNLSKRLTKSSKIYLSDTGLLAHLNYVDAKRLAGDDTAFGTLLENFVATELLKLAAFSDVQPTLHHFRTYDNVEVDFVLERGPRVVGIEVKATSSPGARDYAGLKALRALVGDNFARGVLLYMGERILPIDDTITAVPVSVLWQVDRFQQAQST